MMKREEWAARAQDAARALGADAAETFYAHRDAFVIGVADGQIERCSIAKAGGASLRVQKDGRDGYAYTECFDAPEMLAARALDHARCIEFADLHPMQGAQRYEPVRRCDPPLADKSVQERIALARTLERITLGADVRVRRVVTCTVQTGLGGVTLTNTLGLAAEREARSALCYVEPLVEADGETRTGFAFRMGMEAGDVEACAREAVWDATRQLGGAPVASGSYGVILQNTVLADFLMAFSGIFSAEQAQKGCSLLAGREGEALAAACVTLLDDPFDPVAPRAFDDEGTPCKTKAIVDGGVFQTLLHNLKTARKAGVSTTGNGMRASASSPVDVGPAVLRLQPGAQSFDALVKTLGCGLVITDLQGLHAGLNAVSGDFSLKAAGRRIVNGEDVGAICGITLAGNFLTLLKSVVAVGNDLRFTMPQSCYTAAPSVLVESLRVAGS